MVTTTVDSSSNHYSPTAASDIAVKPAWNKPEANGVAEVGPVMGAHSWPDLSESTKPTAKLTSDSSVKTAADEESTTTPQVRFSYQSLILSLSSDSILFEGRNKFNCKS